MNVFIWMSAHAQKARWVCGTVMQSSNLDHGMAMVALWSTQPPSTEEHTKQSVKGTYYDCHVGR
jgi:hypothetical protein